jgi:hypothetical protein
MSVTVNLELPEAVVAQARRLAEQSRRPLEVELATLLSGILGSGDITGLSDEQAQALEQVQLLSDEHLFQAARQRMAADQTARMQALLDSEKDLSPAEAAELVRLRDRANMLMLIRAEAASVLKQRGLDVSRLLNE